LIRTLFLQKLFYGSKVKSKILVMVFCLVGHYNSYAYCARRAAIFLARIAWYLHLFRFGNGYNVERFFFIPMGSHAMSPTATQVASSLASHSSEFEFFRAINTIFVYKIFRDHDFMVSFFSCMFSKFMYEVFC
jgi:hypothetical protein